MNKMDDFFKKRLNDYTPDEDGWNIPSDHLWEKAKVAFPKKEKEKDRKPLFFLLLGGLIVGLGFGLFIGKIFFANNDSAMVQPVLDQKTERVNTPPQLEEKKSIEKTKQENKKELIGDTETFIETKTNTKTSTDQTEIRNSSKENKEYNAQDDQLKSQSNTKEQLNTILTDPENKSSKGAPLMPGINSAAQKSDVLSGVLDKETEILNTKNAYSETETVNKQNAFDKELNQKQTEEVFTQTLKANTNNTPIQNNEQRSQETIELLNKKELNLKEQNEFESNGSLASDQEKPLLPSVTPLPDFLFPKQEVGLSHLYYLLNLLDPEKYVDIQSDGIDYLHLDKEIRNLNVNYSRWIGKRWSLSTGLHFSRLEVTLDASIYDIFDTDDLNEFLDREIKQVANSEEESLDVMLFDGVELNIGDLLNVKGKVNLRGQVIQVPLFVHFHWYKKRFEYNASLGASLDFVQGKQDEALIYLYRDGQLIAEPFMQPKLEESFLDFSLYANASVRYKLNNNLNLGLSTRISILEPIFTGIEAGIYYRWNR